MALLVITFCSICQILANFSGFERVVPIRFLKKLANCCLVFASSAKSEIRQFHVMLTKINYNNNNNNNNYSTCNKVAKAVKQCSIHFLGVEL